MDGDGGGYESAKLARTAERHADADALSERMSGQTPSRSSAFRALAP
jgi:hypothetical protein